MADGEGYTADELITLATASGCVVTKDQLKRWRRFGILQRPTPAQIPGQRGRRGLYPPGAGQQIETICKLRHGRSLEDLRFRLWWEGHWVDSEAVRTMGRIALEAKARTLEEASDAGNPEDVADNFATKVHNVTDRSGFFRLIRKRLKYDAADFQTVAYTVLSVLLGGDPPPETNVEDERSPKEMLDAALGFDRARTDTFAGSGPWLNDSTTALDSLIDTIELIAQNPRTLADRWSSADDQHIERARLDGRHFLIDFPAMVRMISLLVGGRDAFGWGLLQFSIDDPEDILFFVAAMIVLRQHRPTGEFDELTVAIESDVPIAHAYLFLYEAFPQYRNFFTAEGMSSSESAPDDLRRQFRSDMRAFVAKHPELFEGIPGFSSE